MDTRPWQLQIVAKSLKKKEKVGYLLAGLHVAREETALDLGCAQGTLSYFLRRTGGHWVSADQDLTNLRTTRGLIGSGLVQVEPVRLPFRAGAFDFVALPDYLEHVEDDMGLLAELGRILRPGGRLIVIVPQTGRFHVLHRLRRLLGMRLEDYGHKREGYSPADLSDKLRGAGLRPRAHRTYAKFFSEFLELVLNFGYTRLMRPPAASPLRDGRIRPTTWDEFNSRRQAFRLYSIIYPFIWTAGRLDYLLFFLNGYSLIVWARKGRPRSRTRNRRTP